MKRLIIVSILTTGIMHVCNALMNTEKKEPLSPEATKQLLNAVKLDFSKILRGYSLKACDCIDSLSKALKAQDTVSIMRQVSACIDEQVFGYQLIMKMNQALGATNDANRNISLSTDKNNISTK